MEGDQHNNNKNDEDDVEIDLHRPNAAGSGSNNEHLQRHPPHHSQEYDQFKNPSTEGASGGARQLMKVSQTYLMQNQATTGQQQ